MDPRIEFYKAALFQKGNGFDSPEFKGTSRYQNNQGLGYVLRKIVQFFLRVAHYFKPVAMKCFQIVLKAGSVTIK